jgi:hypothetical protein
MKPTRTIALLTVALLSATTGVLAQERAVMANVPFNFTVGAKLLPAGTYTISSPSSGLVQIKSADGQIATRLVAAQSYHESDRGTELVFNRYGDRYFLHRILCPSTSSLNLDIPSSKSERKSRMREARLQRVEQTLIAAR